MRCGPKWNPVSTAELVRRFRLTEKHLQDQRIDRILARKITLDNEISQLHFNGVREARIQRTARLLGFSVKEVANDRVISDLIKSVFEARQYLATMKPTVKPGDNNVAK